MQSDSARNKFRRPVEEIFVDFDAKRKKVMPLKEDETPELQTRHGESSTAMQAMVASASDSCQYALSSTKTDERPLNCDNIPLFETKVDKTFDHTFFRFALICCTFCNISTVTFETVPQRAFIASIFQCYEEPMNLTINIFTNLILPKEIFLRCQSKHQILMFVDLVV